MDDRQIGLSRWAQTVNRKKTLFFEFFFFLFVENISCFFLILFALLQVETLSRNLPLLATAKRGRFSVIIIENYYKYLNLSPWNRQLLDKYCRDYSVGIVAFLASRPGDYVRLKVKGSPLTLWQKQRAANVRFSSKSRVNYIAKPGAVLETAAPHSTDWVLFDNVNGNFFFKKLVDNFNCGKVCWKNRYTYSAVKI